MTRNSSWLLYGALLVAGAALSLISRAFPAELPGFLPWQFHWVEYLATFLTLAWYGRV